MKARVGETQDDMRAENAFDYATAVRGKYYHRLLKERANVVVLEPDVAHAFRSSAAVHEAPGPAFRFCTGVRDAGDNNHKGGFTMLRRNVRLAICATILAAGISSAGLAFAQTTTRSWSVTPPFPKMYADSPDDWRVFMAFGGTTVTHSGVFLYPASQVAVTVSPALSTTPAYLPAGDYKLTLKVRNSFSSNLARLYATTDNAQVPNPSFSKLIAVCKLNPGTTTKPADTECPGTYKLAQSDLVRAYFTVDNVVQFLSVTFTKP